ncbi:hypothetical protein BOX15_Mlig026085g2 [Macrostomum lignano]|nr:hypothetical protein BOX15_Mlig026085g2 [Macrostomum lignano]
MAFLQRKRLLLRHFSAGCRAPSSDMSDSSRNSHRLSASSVRTATDSIMKWQLALGLLLCTALAAAAPSAEQAEDADAMNALEALANLEESDMSEDGALQPAEKWRRRRRFRWRKAIRVAGKVAKAVL